MRTLIAATLLAAAAPIATAQESLDGIAAGTYTLDPNHTFLTWTVIHNGISEYTVNFTDYDAVIEFNPEDPVSSSVSVTIDPMGIETNYPGDYKAGHPDSGYESWNEALSRGDRFMQADEYPEITFESTSAERTGDTTGTITGDLTFLGTTQPVTLDVTFIGANEGETDVLGFGAVTTITRSEFGMDSLQGPVSDEVTIEFSGEFQQQQ